MEVVVMSKDFDELMNAIQQSIAFEQGDKTAATLVRYNPNDNSEDTETFSNDLRLHMSEDVDHNMEVFENFKFDPNGSWMDIYRTVIDGIANKYWFTPNRKATIEDKVYEFYKKFKNYPPVATAYINFLRSDRLFED